MLFTVRKFCLGFSTMLITSFSWSQDTYLAPDVEAYYLLDRLQTKTKHLSPKFASLNQPFSKKDAAQYIQSISNVKNDANLTQSPFSTIDQYNLNQYIGTNGEDFIQANGMDLMTRSKKPILKHFYTTKAHFYHIHQDDFFLTINPVMRIEVGNEQNNALRPFKNFRGIEARGHIGDRIGFYSMFGDNQERGLSHIINWENQNRSAPGYDYYRFLDNKSIDAFIGRAYVDVTAIKNHMNITFGYDKHHIGSGIRSVKLSNNAAPSTFLRLRTKYKRFNYENLFLELTGTFPGLGDDSRLPRKYASIHQLNYTATPWLQIGLIESSVFNTDGRFNLTNIIPVIGYQSIAHGLGADQRTSWGLNVKALPIKDVQVYGQALIDHIKTSASTTANSRFATQVGVKYYDAFSIPNLDIQLEGNYATPFMYTSADSTTSHTHFNQPMAHPMGAGFTEGIVSIRYQPAKKFYIDLQSVYVKRNEAVAGMNAGTHILTPNIFNYPYGSTNTLMQNGATNSLFLNANIAYELIPNLFIEAGGGYNKFTIAANSNANIYLTGGMRWNIGRRLYNYN